MPPTTVFCVMAISYYNWQKQHEDTHMEWGIIHPEDDSNVVSSEVQRKMTRWIENAPNCEVTGEFSAEVLTKREVYNAVDYIVPYEEKWV